MRDDSDDGAGWMLAYFYGTIEMRDGKRQPDEVSERVARAQAKRCAASLHIADCYSVTKQKTMDVIEAAEALPANMEVHREYFDTDNGFMVFESGYWAVLEQNTGKSHEELWTSNVLLRALSWRIFGGKMHVYGWAGTQDYLTAARSISMRTRAVSMKEIAERCDAIGPLVICAEMVVNLDAYMAKSKEIMRKHGRDILSILLAACLMLNQEVTSRSRVDLPRGFYRFGQRIDMNATRPVTIIDKRPIKSNPTNETLPESTGRRQLTVRYDRRGHWRKYKSERFSAELREHPIWIPAHWVGDESLPIVDRKKVTRLKR
jgi:hypothetical protein